MSQFCYAMSCLTPDNIVSSSIQVTFPRCMIFTLMVHGRSGFHGVHWFLNTIITLTQNSLIFLVMVNCQAQTHPLHLLLVVLVVVVLLMIIKSFFTYSSLVPTTDTTRTSWLLEQMVKIRRPVLLVGDSGTSKTATIHNFLKHLDPDTMVRYICINM